MFVGTRSSLGLAGLRLSVDSTARSLQRRVGDGPHSGESVRHATALAVVALAHRMLHRGRAATDLAHG